MAMDFYRFDQGLPAAPNSGPKTLWMPSHIVADELEKARQAQHSERRMKQRGFFGDRAMSPVDVSQPGAFFSDWNRLTGFNASGGMEKPADEVGFGFLRDSYFRSAIDQVIINTRIAQVRQVARRCLDPQKHAGWRIVHKMHFSPDFRETPAIKAACEEVAQVIEHPNGWVHPGGLVDVLTIMVREQLTIDRKALSISRDRLRRPVAGYWHLIDAATVLPRLEVLYPWISKHLTNPAPESGYDEETIQSAIDAAISDIFQSSGVNLEDAGWVQEVDSHITAAWKPHQLSMHITQPSVVINKVPYGQGSLLQQSLDLTAGWVNFWQYNQSHFRTNYPEKALILHGEYDPNGLEAYKRKLFGEAGPASWERLLILPGDEDTKAEALDLGAAPKDLMWDKLADMIIRLKCGVYRMDPSTIGWDSHGGETGLIFNAPNRETQVAMAQEEGFHGLLQDLSTWITEALVKPWNPDLIFFFDGLQRQQERERIQLSSEAVEHYWTLDEARQKENLAPLPGGLGKLPLWAAKAQLQQNHQTAMAKQQQQWAASQPVGETESASPLKGDQGSVLPGRDLLPGGKPSVRKSLTITLEDEEE